MMTMKWMGLFHTIFIFYQELDLYYGNKPLYLRHIPIAIWQQKFEINFVLIFELIYHKYINI